MLHGLTIIIERLEPLRVATISITGESPEEDAINALLGWAGPRGLLNGDYRFFGYDNCKPHPNHTYTAWLTVDQTVEDSHRVKIEDFPGGLFVTTEIQGTELISSAWQQLQHWVERNGTNSVICPASKST